MQNLKNGLIFFFIIGHRRKSPFCTFSCINPGFGRPWDMLRKKNSYCHFHNASKECFWPKKILNFMHGFKSAILAKMKNCQNGTFKPVYEIKNFFWPNVFFWSIMEMAIRNFFHNMSQGLPNPGFMQEKVQKGDFLWCPMMKTNFNPFFRFYTSRVHDFC